MDSDADVKMYTVFLLWKQTSKCIQCSYYESRRQNVYSVLTMKFTIHIDSDADVKMYTVFLLWNLQFIVSAKSAFSRGVLSYDLSALILQCQTLFSSFDNKL